MSHKQHFLQKSGKFVKKISIVLLGTIISTNINSTVIEYPEELKDIVVPKLKEYMEKGASVLCKKLPIPCVPETGNHWIH